MAKYRKKPVVIEAFQLTEACRKDQRQWSDGGGAPFRCVVDYKHDCGYFYSGVEW